MRNCGAISAGNVLIFSRKLSQLQVKYIWETGHYKHNVLKRLETPPNWVDCYEDYIRAVLAQDSIESVQSICLSDKKTTKSCLHLSANCIYFCTQISLILQVTRLLQLITQHLSSYSRKSYITVVLSDSEVAFL